MAKKHISFTLKIILFMLFFSFFFYWLHMDGRFNIRSVLADLGGIPWLYSSLVTLFSVLAGFIIQKEWENWNNLLDAVKSEVDALREFWIWSRHLPEQYRDVFDHGVKKYLKEMSATGLDKSARKEISAEIEDSFTDLQEAMSMMAKQDQVLMSSTFSLFSKILECRTNRLRYSSHHIPESLRRSLFFITVLVITLGLFIGIKNITLDYVFTASVSLVAYVIYIVIDDLDNPLKPGNWHITTNDYGNLLGQISIKRK